MRGKMSWLASRGWLVLGVAITAGLVLYTSVSLASGGTPSKGRIPDAALKDGGIDKSLVPDFIPALDANGIVVGYVAKDLAIPDGAPSDDPPPVYADDLKTIVGHMYPGIGFVPLNVDPSRVPRRPVTSSAK